MLTEGGAPVTVVVVDDEPGAASTVVEHLERSDDRIEAEAITDPERALDRIEEDGCDCVVSDYDMAPIDGLELVRELRHHGDDVPFLLYTGRGDEAVASEAISAGVDDYMVKGRTEREFEVLARKIRQLAEKQRTQRQMAEAIDAIENAQEGIGFLDEDGRFTYVNRRYAETYGYEPEELIGEHWRLLYEAGDVQRIEEEVLPTVERRGVWRGRTRGKRRDGSTFPEDHRIVERRDGGMIFTVRDASQGRDGSPIERDDHRLRDAIDTLPDLFYVVDESGALMQWNRRLEEEMGYSDDELARMHATDLVAESDVNVVQEAFDAVAESGGTVRIRARLVTDVGRDVPFDLAVAPLRNGDDDIVGLTGTGRRVEHEEDQPTDVS